MSFWRDVDPATATDECDGERLLLGWKDALYPTCFGYWDEDIQQFCDEEVGNDFTIQPDFWMVVPAVPR